MLRAAAIAVGTKPRYIICGVWRLKREEEEMVYVLPDDAI